MDFHQQGDYSVSPCVWKIILRLVFKYLLRGGIQYHWARSQSMYTIGMKLLSMVSDVRLFFFHKKFFVLCQDFCCLKISRTKKKRIKVNVVKKYALSASFKLYSNFVQLVEVSTCTCKNFAKILQYFWGLSLPQHTHFFLGGGEMTVSSQVQ